MSFIFSIQAQPENGALKDIRAVDARISASDLNLPPDEFIARFLTPMAKALLKSLTTKAA